MRKSLLIEWRKAVCGKGILFAALGIFVIHRLNLADEIRLHAGYASGSVLYFWRYRHGLGAFSDLLLLLCALPYALQFCREKNSGNWKYYLIREKAAVYGSSKVIMSAAAALLAGLAGYLLLFGCLAARYPLFPEDAELLAQMVQGMPFAALALERKAGFFFAGLWPELFLFAFLATAALTVSAFSENRYVILSAPLLIFYGWNYFTGLFRLPEIFWWPLKQETGFQFWENDGGNLLFTAAYYAVGILFLGRIFQGRLRREREHV